MNDRHVIALIAHDTLRSAKRRPTERSIAAAVAYAQDVLAATKGKGKRRATKRAGRRKKR